MQSTLRLLVNRHSNETELYINGRRAAAAAADGLIFYQERLIADDAYATVHPGENVIAVHCTYNDSAKRSAHMIDVALIDLVQSEERR